MSPHKLSQMKKEAAVFAVNIIQPGMVVGMGTGSTANFAVEEIARKINEGLLSDIICIPSSNQTKELALAIGIKVYGFDKVIRLDINIDGADEIDKNINLIKGGGGALLREKIIAQNCRRNIVIIDESKVSNQLGEKWHLPVEVLPYSWKLEAAFIESIGAKVKLRENPENQPIVTDQDNFILDCNFGIISEPLQLALELEKRAGIIEHGLFINTTNDIVIGKPDGIDHKQIKR